MDPRALVRQSTLFWPTMANQSPAKCDTCLKHLEVASPRQCGELKTYCLGLYIATMVYSKEYNFLFVHIQKTGGTSISHALANRENNHFLEPPHLRLCDIRMPMRKPFTFAVVRNPWERLASWWFMMQKRQIHNDFSEYLLCPDQSEEPVTFSSFIRRTNVIYESKVHHTHVWPVQWPWKRPYSKSLGWNQEDYLMRRGQFQADAVLRFERLQLDWASIMHRISPDVFIPLPHLNASSTDQSANWSALYEDGQDIDFVAKQFKRDIQRWNFSFNPS